MGLSAVQGIRLNPQSLGPITLFLSSCLLIRYEKRPFYIRHLCQNGHFHRPLFTLIVPNSPHSQSPPLDLPPNIACTLYPACQYFILRSLFQNHLRAISTQMGYFPTNYTHTFIVMGVASTVRAQMTLFNKLM